MHPGIKTEPVSTAQAHILLITAPWSPTCSPGYGIIKKKPSPHPRPCANSVPARKRSVRTASLQPLVQPSPDAVPSDTVARETSSTATQLGVPSTFAVISMWLGRLLGCCAA